MPLSARIATASDLPLLAAWNLQLIEDEGHENSMNEADLLERMRLWLGSNYNAAIMELDERPVAYALWREEDDAVYLKQFFMDRAMRRRGLGREGVQIWLDKFRPRNKKVWLEALIHNEAGRKFWAACGFGEYAVSMRLKDGE